MPGYAAAGTISAALSRAEKEASCSSIIAPPPKPTHMNTIFHLRGFRLKHMRHLASRTAYCLRVGRDEPWCTRGYKVRPSRKRRAQWRPSVMAG